MMKISCYLLVSLSLFSAPLRAESPKKEDISAVEDLMREHGILNRLLLIYQEIATRIETYQEFPVQTLVDAAKIIRSFIENYHEKLEEDYIFPKFEKADILTDVIKTLRDQHEAGREITHYILTNASENFLKSALQKMAIANHMKLFIRMYRPHEAREDTVIFPEFKKLISPQEYDQLGEIFEDKEHELFGKEGFNTVLSEIVRLEKILNINSLSKFTPSLD